MGNYDSAKQFGSVMGGCQIDSIRVPKWEIMIRQSNLVLSRVAIIRF